MEYTVTMKKCGKTNYVQIENNLSKKLAIKKGEYITVSIKKDQQIDTFSSVFSRMICIRQSTIKKLNLHTNDKICITIKKLINIERTHDIIHDGKVDTLSLIPDVTSNRYPIVVSQFMINEEIWLRCWYVYKNGSARQIEIKRFVDQTHIGSLLGQMQAEGTKYKNIRRKMAVEFSNKLIAEHEDFIKNLEALGINKSHFEFRLTDSENKSSIILNILSEEFSEKIGATPKIYSHYCKRGGYGYKTIYRSTLLVEIILYAMDIVRKFSIENPNTQLAKAFLAKLLTGDGTIRIDRRVSTRVKIGIKDKDMEYLIDYAKILKNMNFTYVKIYDKYFMVEAYCPFDRLLFLYEIQAFMNTKNWDKLLISVMMCLKGGIRKTKTRFLDLAEKEPFTQREISAEYGLHKNDRKWLISMFNKGYIARDINKIPYEYRLTFKARKLVNMIIEINRKISELQDLNNTNDLSTLLDMQKRKISAK